MNEGDRHAPFADPGRDALDRSRSHVARGEDPGKAIADWTLTSLREKLIKIGAKVVSHGRYVTFQMAEVAIPRAVFAELLPRFGDSSRFSGISVARRQNVGPEAACAVTARPSMG